MFLLVSYAVELNLPGLTARGARFLGPAYLALGAGLIGALALGGWLGMQLGGDRARDEAGPPRVGPSSADVDRAAGVVGGIALAAYLFWFRDYLLDPGGLWAILSGAATPARADQLVPGVTSLANGAPVFFAVHAWRRVFRPQDPMPGWMHGLLLALVVLTVFRVYAWSERLALIEAVVPMLLTYAVKAAGAGSVALRRLLGLGPVLALPLLVFYFGLAESVRSWTSDTYHGKIGFWDFAIGRVATYYYTALNNGAGYLATQEWPTFRFEYTLSMLHTAPLSVGRIFSALVGSQGQDFDRFLLSYADPEFNNPSGFYTVVYDLGIPLGIAYFAFAGFIAGWLYRRWLSGSLAAGLFHPVMFIAALEVFRYPYLGSGRAFAWGVCAVLVIVLVHVGRAARGVDEPAPTANPVARHPF